MSVRAKFKCNSKESLNPGEPELGGTVKLEPVYSGSQENEQFYKWTPGGQIVLSTINESALNQFEPGREYYVDFTPATAA
jgi:hypothetical protein